MPVLLQASQQTPQVRFLWINQGETPEKAARYATQQGLPLASVLLDADSGLSHLLGLKALPTTLFYDAQGRLIIQFFGERHEGEDERQDWRALAESLPRLPASIAA